MPVARTKWDSKREASYAALVESAMRCFHHRGYAATRVEDIVAATPYTSGAFYFHFPNKRDCFWHVLDHRERLRGDWAASATDGLDPATPLQDVLARVFARFAEAEQGLSAWVLVMVEFHQQHRGDADAAARLRGTYVAWHANVARFVTALQEGGWVSRDRDPDALARQVFAFVEGSLAHGELYGSDADVIEGVARLLA
jgi:AcrR family transcriptional regulator